LHAATPTPGFCLMKCSQMRGAPLLQSRNAGIWHRHLVNLLLRSHNNNTMPLRAFTRRHYNVLEAGGAIWWWLGGGWCKPRVLPKIAKIRLRFIRVCCVCRINGVLIDMGRLKSPYDPSLKNTVKYVMNTIRRIICLRRMTHPCILPIKKQSPPLYLLLQ
jgi:hypothetical protein